MCEFWYDYVKVKNVENAKRCHIVTDSFNIYIQIIFTKILRKMLKQDLILQIWYFETDRRFPKGKKWKSN